MRFERYECYKDSGLEWLGEIPCEWGVKRVKDYTKTFSGTTPQSGNSQYYENGHTYWIRTTDLNNDELYESEFRLTDKAFRDYSLKKLPYNSVLLAMYGGIGTIGKNAILKIKATLNQSVCSILPNQYKYDSKYLLYFMQYFRYKWIIFANSSRKDPNINQDAILNLFTIFPPLKTQTKIATYLDTKTKKIDKEIALLEQKIEKYRELKQTLINETVLRGLDRGVEFKDSGIEWIGEIPKGWEVKRLKGNIFTIKGKNLETIENQKNDYLPNLSLDYLRKGKNSSTTYSKSNDKKMLVTDKDFIIIWDGASVGEILKGKKGYLSSTIAKLIFNKRSIIQEYFYYFYFELNYILKKIPAGMGIPHLNPTILNQFIIPFPPLKEQVKIANYLDEKTQKIDNITQTISKKIELLKEFRKTLINDVVTGRVKV